MDKNKIRKRNLIIIACILGIFLIWLLYYVLRYASYDKYKDYLSSYDYEEGIAFKPISESKSDVKDMVLAAESDSLKLYVNASTGEAAIYDKRNNTTTYTNPAGADEDSIANVTNKNYLHSQMIIDYYNTSRLESTFDSYSFCVEREQLEVEGVKDGVRFLYTVGDMTGETGIVPQYISAKTLDEVASKLSESDAKNLRKKYIESKVADDYYELLESAVNGPSQIRKLNAAFEEAGFTKEDYEREMLGSGVEGAVPISFVIPLEYRLYDDYVEVSVPMKGVIENGGGAIHRIQLLNFFAAGDKTETGYMLVPNGSGSLINFNNDKGKLIAGNDYSEFIYGIDPLAAEYTVREITTNSRMALFGIFRDKSGILATIEDGASLANVTANVAGEVNEFNNVYATFVLRGDDKLSMFGTTGSEAELPVVETNFYDTDITVRYTFLDEKDADYQGAANYLRERYIKEGILTPNEETGDIKLYYDILGGVERTEYFLGKQYRGLYAMTTFDEAADIYDELSDKGICNQAMIYKGWTKGGYYHDILGKAKIIGKLGGKSGLYELNDRISEGGGTFYADAALQKISYVSSHYSVSNETSRYYGTGYVADFGLVNPTTLRQTSGLGYDENLYYLISPKFLVRHTEKFIKSVDKLDIAGVSLRDFGDELHSDKKRTNTINREEALDVVRAEFNLLEDTGKKILVSGGNDYTFPYVSDIINAPLSDNEYYVIDKAVPFYEMLIHGCIDYSGDIINLSNTTDIDEIVLDLIDMGASPHFMFSKASSNELKDTGINMMYSTTFDNWKDDAVLIYERTNEALKNVNGAFITGREDIDEGVTLTSYSNGVKLYVNKTEADVSADGITVPAKGYAIGK